MDVMTIFLAICLVALAGLTLTYGVSAFRRKAVTPKIIQLRVKVTHVMNKSVTHWRINTGEPISVEKFQELLKEAANQWEPLFGVAFSGNDAEIMTDTSPEDIEHVMKSICRKMERMTLDKLRFNTQMKKEPMNAVGYDSATAV